LTAGEITRDALWRIIAIGERLDDLRPFEESDLTIELDEVRSMVGALEHDLTNGLREAA
jgi:hypothetical protein